jgi:hypothetical protein
MLDRLSPLVPPTSSGASSPAGMSAAIGQGLCPGRRDRRRLRRHYLSASIKGCLLPFALCPPQSALCARGKMKGTSPAEVGWCPSWRPLLCGKRKLRPVLDSPVSSTRPESGKPPILPPPRCWLQIILSLKEVTRPLILHLRDRQECRRAAVQYAGFVPVKGTPGRTLPPFCVTDAFAIGPDDDPM